MKDKILAHIEKAALAICLLLLFYLAWSGLTIPVYEKLPAQFQSVTDTARTTVNATAPAPDALKGMDVEGEAAKTREPVDPQAFHLRKELRRPFDLGMTFRKEPEILKAGPPIVQSNRALFAVYKSDLEGKRITRKVRKSDAQNPVLAQGNTPAASGASSEKEFMEAFQGMFGPRGGATGGRGKMRFTTNVLKNAARTGIDTREAMFVGNTDDGAAAPASPSYAPAPTGVAAIGKPAGGSGRAILAKPPESISSKKKENKADRGKDEEWVEEYVVTMQGKEFVEIVSSFPHSEQIKKYVEALREPANFVGLRYALADVERREMLMNLQWSDWSTVDLPEQYEFVQNAAYGHEEEPFPAVVMKGLAMNIPKNFSLFKDFVTAPEFQQPEEAVYKPEEMNPRLAVKKKPEDDAPSRRRLKGARKDRPAVTGEDAVKRIFSIDPRGVDLSLPANPAGSPGGQPGQPGQPGGPGAAPGATQFDNRYQVKTAMIRFWDFTVKPGRRYQYKVRVKVYNPNALRSDVADAEFRGKLYLVGPWSEPSPEIYVEPNVRWYARERDRSDRTVIEVHSWSPEVGKWLVNTFKQRPGDLIGVSPTPRVNTLQVWDENAKKMVVKEQDLRREFDANSIILDIWGGRERIGATSRTYPVPVEVVAVDALGDLVRKDSATDGENYERVEIAKHFDSWTKSFSKPTTSEEESEDSEDADRARRRP